MYYMVTATHVKDGEKGVTFEYVASAPDVECVYSMAEDSGERVLSIREMTMPELIEHEKQDLMTRLRGRMFLRNIRTRILKLGCKN